MEIDLRAVLPLILLGIALVGYCIFDIARAEEVRWLPKWAWVVICMVSLPLGPILYLTLGRADR